MYHFNIYEFGIIGKLIKSSVSKCKKSNFVKSRQDVPFVVLGHWKYKHSYYWFMNSWNSRSNFRKVRKQTQFFSVKPISKINARVLSLKDTNLVREQGWHGPPNFVIVYIIIVWSHQEKEKSQWQRRLQNPYVVVNLRIRKAYQDRHRTLESVLDGGHRCSALCVLGKFA